MKKQFCFVTSILILVLFFTATVSFAQQGIPLKQLMEIGKLKFEKVEGLIKDHGFITDNRYVDPEDRHSDKRIEASQTAKSTDEEEPDLKRKIWFTEDNFTITSHYTNELRYETNDLNEFDTMMEYIHANGFYLDPEFDHYTNGIVSFSLRDVREKLKNGGFRRNYVFKMKTKIPVPANKK